MSTNNFFRAVVRPPGQTGGWPETLGHWFFDDRDEASLAAAYAAAAEAKSARPGGRIVVFRVPPSRAGETLFMRVGAILPCPDGHHLPVADHDASKKRAEEPDARAACRRCGIVAPLRRDASASP